MEKVIPIKADQAQPEPEQTQESKPFDIVVVETKQTVFQILAQSKLPLSVLCLIISDLSRDLQSQLDKYIASTK